LTGEDIPLRRADRASRAVLRPRAVAGLRLGSRQQADVSDGRAERTQRSGDPSMLRIVLVWS